MIRRSLALSVLTLLGPATGYAHPESVQPVNPPKVIHVVRGGETLSLLAKRYRVSVATLAGANGLTSPHRIRVGKKLVIPGPRTRGLPPYFVLKRRAFTSRVPEFGWPVEGPVSSHFGHRRGGWHAGIDIKAAVGTPIFAAAPGTVYYSGWERRYGFVVKIQHPDGFVTLYAHALQIFVEAGDEVHGGQVIAAVGRTGRASAYHLHFEIRNNGTGYNPLYFLPAQEASAAPEESAQPEDTDEDEE